MRVFWRWWTDVCFRCSRRPRALLVCHSDGGTEPPLSETLLFCSVGAPRSLLQPSPCRCQQRVDLCAVVHRWLLRDREAISSIHFFKKNQSPLMFLTVLTAFVVLEIVACIAVSFSCFQSPEPREICNHAVGGAVHHT